MPFIAQKFTTLSNLKFVRKVLEEEAWTEQRFVRPSAFSDYNSAMGGADLHD